MSTAPPWRYAISRTIASPSPEPSPGVPFTRWNRSSTRSRSAAGMPGPLSSTSRKAPPVAASGAQRHLAAARRVVQRVVDEVRGELDEQAGLARDRRRLELEPEVDRLRVGARDPVRDAGLGHRGEIGRLRRERAPGGRLDGGEREELAREVRGAARRGVQVLHGRGELRRHRLAPRRVDLRLQRGERRAELVRGVGDEPLLRVDRLAEAAEEVVQRLHERPHLDRRRVLRDRAQVARRAAARARRAGPRAARARVRRRTTPPRARRRRTRPRAARSRRGAGAPSARA